MLKQNECILVEQGLPICMCVLHHGAPASGRCCPYFGNALICNASPETMLCKLTSMHSTSCSPHVYLWPKVVPSDSSVTSASSSAHCTLRPCPTLSSALGGNVHRHIAPGRPSTSRRSQMKSQIPMAGCSQMKSPWMHRQRS